MSESTGIPEIAIIGLSGEFPGAKNVDEYWENICKKIDSTKILNEKEALELGIPSDTFKQRNFVPVVNQLTDPDLFDAVFFEFSPKEAEITDPQQRRLLEHSHWALENASYCPSKTDKKIAMYAGVGFSTYLLKYILNDDSIRNSVGAMQLMTGNDKDYAATKVAYKLGLNGPVVNLGTACSTSLVAMHMASRALLGYEADIALAGAAKIDFLSNLGQLFQPGGIFSSDGKTRSFDANASGTTFGDGVGVVVLKRLEDALEDRDHIYAVIKASAINNDGSEKIGYAAPSIGAQSDVISITHRLANISSESIQLVEAHGTATPLGDPIEIAALTRAFRKTSERNKFCAIGSSKTNVGHLDSAAGMAGVFKAVKAIEHSKLPPSLHFNTPNPEIDFDNSPFYVNTSLLDWPRLETPRRAGVSSFGVGGTNAHLLLEEPPEKAAPKIMRNFTTLQISAKNKESLQEMCGNLASYLSTSDNASLHDIAYTLRIGRGDYSHRYFVSANTRRDAIEEISKFEEDKIAVVDMERQTTVYFMFSGQGSQFVNMSRALYHEEPLFKDILDTCADYLLHEMGADIRKILYSDNWNSEISFNSTRIVQPILFSVEYALAKLWMSWGVRPKGMIGHSLGEYVAACIAGVFTLPEALKLVARRGALMEELPKGDMIAVSASQERVADIVINGISLAAVNAENQCVLSGSSEKIIEQISILSKADIRYSSISTSHAFHSEMMRPIINELKLLLSSFNLKGPRIPYVSNVTGTWISPGEATSSDYYIRHMLEPVQFYSGIKLLDRRPGTVFLELGPGETLTKLAKRTVGEGSLGVVPSLNTSRSDISAGGALAEAVGRLWSFGQCINWSQYYSAERLSRVPLPGYVFKRQKFWVKSEGKFEPNEKALPSNDIEKQKVEKWFYRPSWQESVLAESADACDLKCVLVLGSDQSAIDNFSRLLPNVITVKCGDRYDNPSKSTYIINPSNTDDYNVLVKQLISNNDVISHVVNLLPLDVNGISNYDEDEFSSERIGLVNAIKYLACEIDNMTLDAVRMLTVVRNSPHSVGVSQRAKTPTVLMSATLSAVINQEMPRLTCRIVELENDVLANGTANEVILSELLNGDNALEVSYHYGKRWIKTYQPFSAHNNSASNIIHPAGVYVITGGLGNVGFSLASQLARNFSPNLCLVSRSSLPPRSSWESIIDDVDSCPELCSKLKKVISLESYCARVSVYQADVANSVSIEKALSKIRSKHGSINGIVHAAGTYSFSNLVDQSSADTDRVYSPKITGTLNLSKATEKDNLDFMVLISSISSVLGGIGYGAYATANAFLDGYAHFMQSEGRKEWISVNWDAWEDEDESQESKSTLMKTAIQREEGQIAFDMVLRNTHLPQIVVSTTDLQFRIKQWVQRSSSDKELDNIFEAENSYENMNRVEEVCLKIWQGVFGSSNFGLDDDFFELGGDSLLGMTLVAELQKKFKVNIYLRAIFDSPTVRKFVKYFEENYPDEVSKINGNFFAPANQNEMLSWDDYLDVRNQVSKKYIFNDVHTKIPGKIVFILSAPRSGSTLFRVMLGGSSELCAPPELELLCYKDLDERMNAYGEASKYRNNGLLSLIKRAYDCDDDKSKKIMARYVSDNSVEGVYVDIFRNLGNLILVDKSPIYSHNTNILNRINATFENAKFIHLQRHPGGMVSSFNKARLDLLGDKKLDMAPSKLAELQWNLANRSIQEFFLGVDDARKYCLKFEDLLADPESTVKAVCQFLEIEFDSDMLEPYKEQNKRMTDPDMQVGDPNFHLHKVIDPSRADEWRDEIDFDQFADFTIELARDQGYTFNKSVSQQQESTEFNELDLEALDHLDDEELNKILKSVLVE